MLKIEYYIATGAATGIPLGVSPDGWFQTSQAHWQSNSTAAKVLGFRTIFQEMSLNWVNCTSGNSSEGLDV